MFQGYVKVDFMGFYGGFNDLLIVYSRVFSVISITTGCPTKRFTNFQNFSVFLPENLCQNI